MAGGGGGNAVESVRVFQTLAAPVQYRSITINPIDVRVSTSKTGQGAGRWLSKLV